MSVFIYHINVAPLMHETHLLLTADTTMTGSFCVDIDKPLELLDPTHRGLHRFIPRHPDEIEIDIGDPVYVQKEAEDLWCEGKTRQQEKNKSCF